MPKISSHLNELLGVLPPIEPQKEKVSQRLEEVPSETKLLELSKNSVEKDAEILHEVLRKLKKL